jgi:subtilase family serine protease
MRNIDFMEAELLEISDPASPRYGEWKTQAEVNEATAPAPETRAAVRSWFEARGASCVDMPHSLKCHAAVGAVEKMFSTRVSAFKQTTRDDSRVLRIHPKDAYAFPEELKGQLEFVTSLADFPTVRRKLGKTAS